MDDLYHVICDGNILQHGLTNTKAMAFAEVLGGMGDKHTNGTKTRTSEFQVKRCLCIKKEEDALYKEFRRKTVVVHP